MYIYPGDCNEGIQAATEQPPANFLLLFKFLNLTEKKKKCMCSIMDNIILLHIDYSLYLYMYILKICCSALSAGKWGGGGGGVNAMLAKHITQKYMA